MSFSDMMSSGKGPGVIGLLLALVVLGGFVILGTLTLDERFQGDGLTIDAKLRQQKRDIMNMQLQLETSQRRLSEHTNLERIAKDLAVRETELQNQEQSISKAHETIARIREDLSVLEQTFQNHKQQYRTAVRDAVKGTTLATLETLGGEILHDVTIREVNAIGMQVMHREGSKRIAYKDLPLAMQEYYQFDPDEMKAATAAENLVHQANNRALAAADEAAKLKALGKKQEEQQAAAVNRQHAIAATTSRINTLTREISNLESDISREANKTISRAPQMRRQLANMQREKSELEIKLQGLRATP